MELKLNIGLNQVIGLIRNLPYDDKLILKSQLDKELKPVGKRSGSSLKHILLKGPVMTAEGYDNYKDLKKQFSKWTKKLSV
jgi:hypothetical protein